jgi:hypothetical protein
MFRQLQHHEWLVSETSTPVITANWEEDSNERWTVPFGLGIGRLFKISKRPVDCKLQTF